MTIEKIHYAHTLHIASLNVQGLKAVSKIDQIIHIIRKKNIDVLAMQETHIPTNLFFVKDGYVFFFSATPSKRKNPNQKGKQNIEVEYAGVGFCYKIEFESSRINYKQMSGRNTSVKFLY